MNFCFVKANGHDKLQDEDFAASYILVYLVGANQEVSRQLL